MDLLSVVHAGDFPDASGGGERVVLLLLLLLRVGFRWWCCCGRDLAPALLPQRQQPHGCGFGFGFGEEERNFPRVLVEIWVEVESKETNMLSPIPPLISGSYSGINGGGGRREGGGGLAGMRGRREGGGGFAGTIGRRGHEREEDATRKI